jgi:gamma-glutamylcyclotransferase (GGCT)/AIG2-like uncharacterized protein YtfP
MGRTLSVLSLAYGSDLDSEQMRSRCPSARFICVAELRDHNLVFPRRSKVRGCGVASIEARRGSSVWGVVYQIDEVDVAKLDASEGYMPGRESGKNSYVREERHVHADGDEAKPLLVWVYVAHPHAKPPLPNVDYKQLIVDGAKSWHLPGEYISELEQIEVQK